MRPSLALTLLFACTTPAPTPAPASPSPTVFVPASAPASAPAPAPASASVLALAPALASAPADLRLPTDWSADRNQSGPERVARAEALRLPTVKNLFAAAAVPFPPRQLYLRAFKREGELEVWASGKSDGPVTRIATYRICYASGSLGPKRREGDRQVPEGFYHLAMFNPASRFHLALLVSYPNAADRVFADPEHPGGEIMIHGSCVSIGCLAMSDERAEELYLIARAAPSPVPVALLPTRKLDELIASEEMPEHHAFWSNLREGFARFEADHRIPRVTIDAGGRYRFR